MRQPSDSTPLPGSALAVPKASLSRRGRRPPCRFPLAPAVCAGYAAFRGDAADPFALCVPNCRNRPRRRNIPAAACQFRGPNEVGFFFTLADTNNACKAMGAADRLNGTVFAGRNYKLTVLANSSVSSFHGGCDEKCTPASCFLKYDPGRPSTLATHVVTAKATGLSRRN